MGRDATPPPSRSTGLAQGATLSPWLTGMSWLAAAAAATVLLVTVRTRIGAAHVTLAYLLIVLAASASAGRRVGLLLAAACFLAFNYFFVPPYGTLAVHDPLDWLVLLAFMATSAVAAQLLHRAQTGTASARRHAQEMRRLATLGVEALQAPRAEDAVVAIARVIREELGVEQCELYLRDPSSERLHLVASATAGGAVGAGSEGAGVEGDASQSAVDVLLAGDARTLLLPLQVRSRQVGLLRLHSVTVIPPGSAGHPYAEALAFFAALGLERIRLTTAAAHADALREADRLKDAVLAAVSHDLRTPLTAIKAMAREIAESGDARAAAVETEADRLNSYVTNLLDLSRLNAGALPVSLELVPAEDVIGALLEQVAAFAGGREVRATVSTDGSMPAGRLDFVLTLRALANVVDNAMRYTPSSTPIDVEARREGSRLLIEVADRGPGIPDGDRERVFEPFQRGAGARDAAGAGLGLPIARRLVEAQGGTLVFASREGGGTVFTIALPSADVGPLVQES